MFTLGVLLCSGVVEETKFPVGVGLSKRLLLLLRLSEAILAAGSSKRLLLLVRLVELVSFIVERYEPVEE